MKLKYVILDKKLNKLKNSQKIEERIQNLLSYYPRLINNTNINFSSGELAVVYVGSECIKKSTYC